jgi:hypothetical protein
MEAAEKVHRWWRSGSPGEPSCGQGDTLGDIGLPGNGNLPSCRGRAVRRCAIAFDRWLVGWCAGIEPVGVAGFAAAPWDERIAELPCCCAADAPDARTPVAERRRQATSVP